MDSLVRKVSNRSSVADFGVRTLGSRLNRENLESQVALYSAVALMAIIIFVGCAGNLMVILAVRTTKKLQTVSNAFVVNLSVCDLLFVTVILPFNIYTYLTDGWNLPQVLCKAIGFLGYTLTGTTIITITLIAWNRYKLVVDCQSYRRLFSPRRIAVMLTLAWVVPMLSLLPALLEVWGRFGYVAMMVTCNLLLDHDSQSFKLFLLIARAVVPCTLIIYYYVRIYRTTKASHRRVRQGRLLAASVGQLDQMIQRKELHLTKMMATIFIVFALSYFPCTVSSIVDWNTVLSKRFHMFCLITIYMGSAVNPLIYGLMNSQFRLAYYSILLCQCCRLPAKGTHCRMDAASPALSSKIYNKRTKSRKSPASKLTSDTGDQTPVSSPPQKQHVCKYTTASDCDTPLSSPETAARAKVTIVSDSPLSSPEPSVRRFGILHRTETEKTCVPDYEQEVPFSEELFQADHV